MSLSRAAGPIRSAREGGRPRVARAARLAALGAVCAVALGACRGAHDETRPASAPSPAAAPRSVRVVPVTRVGGGAQALVAARVEARQRAVLSARVPATVVALPARVGQRVARGALLVRLDDAAFAAALEAAQASLHAAQAESARVANLLAKNAATPRERDEAQAREAAARAALSAARDSLAYAVLRAPFSGTVAARQVELGDVVQPGRPLIEVEGDDGLELRTTVDGAQAAGLRRGQTLRAEVDGQPQALRAVISAVALAGDPGTHRFEVRADLPAAAGLRSGLFARLALPGAGGESGLSVPVEAVFARGGLTGVFVAQDGRAHLRFIAPGARSGATLEVRAGLSEGERVVLEPQGLSDGAPLDVREVR